MQEEHVREMRLSVPHCVSYQAAFKWLVIILILIILITRFKPTPTATPTPFP